MNIALSAAADPGPLPGTTRPALLIVDDEEANLRLYGAVLKDCGAELVMASSGAQALAASQRREFAMILLDVRLPDMSGFAVARQLREAEPAVVAPIVLVSAVHTADNDAFRGYDLGAVDYLFSPVVPAILRAKAAVFIRMHRMNQDALGQRIAMELAYRELHDAHAELEQFSFTVAHDLRTPLSHVCGISTMLLSQCAGVLDVRSQKLLAMMNASALGMVILIEDLLQLSRATEGLLVREPVDLSALARKAATDLAAADPGRDVRWHLGDGVSAQGDPGLLQAALTNLLANAWKYSARAKSPCIEFGRVRSDGADVYFVADNGAGFDATAAAGKPFRPFQRFHARDDFEGNGIGLALVQRVISRHGGRIWVESSPGAGARFLFTLPGSADPTLIEAKSR